MTNLRYGNTFNFICNKYDEVIQHGCINLDNMHKNNKKGNKKKYINIFPIMKVLVICLLLSLVNKSNDVRRRINICIILLYLYNIIYNIYIIYILYI
ncbi:hypothetical protein PFAG_02677 [Plasmodium falciparum Santa Lucia]|uniref:Uncharacterized protein n=1 Tax=Plasmodium falciparum Santa Lucia TaxID=478859 RepID=W7G690_PLAFA|nr:hypothetical protein PFAG_02677 [Plasmodium falciparum Santa Lucia]